MMWVEATAVAPSAQTRALFHLQAPAPPGPSRSAAPSLLYPPLSIRSNALVPTMNENNEVSRQENKDKLENTPHI